MTGEPDRAEERFRLALGELGGSGMGQEIALLHQCYGSWLRRGRRHREARELLGTALEEFSELGTPFFADLTRSELLAAGGGGTRRSGRTDLTPQQLRIARLATDGLPNPEIARRLVLSPHTVRCHLYRVFHKLGINNRLQLAAALPVDPRAAG